MDERKSFLIRIDGALLNEVRRWADDELRSLNGQIEFILRQALKDRGRSKKPQNETETALYYKECSAVSESDYRPDTVLPPNLDLNWWTFPIKCDLQPGAYIVDTSWTFHVMFFERTVRAVSNVF